MPLARWDVTQGLSRRNPRPSPRTRRIRSPSSPRQHADDRPLAATEHLFSAPRGHLQDARHSLCNVLKSFAGTRLQQDKIHRTNPAALLLESIEDERAVGFPNRDPRNLGDSGFQHAGERSGCDVFDLADALACLEVNFAVLEVHHIPGHTNIVQFLGSDPSTLMARCRNLRPFPGGQVAVFGHDHLTVVRVNQVPTGGPSPEFLDVEAGGPAGFGWSRRPRRPPHGNTWSRRRRRPACLPTSSRGCGAAR